MKIIKMLFNAWYFVAHLAYIVTKIDEFFEQCKTFRDWLKGGDDNEPDKKVEEQVL